MILEQLLVGNMAVFAYIIGCEDTKDTAVVDPDGGVDEVLRFTEKKNLNITKIINTHGHIDHVNGNADMVERTGAKIYLHKDDVKIFDSFENKMFLAAVGGKPSPQPDVLLDDGDVINIGKVAVKVLHTPGHSPGGVCLIVDSNILTGDTLFVGGVGRTDLTGGDAKVLYRSITERLFTLDKQMVVLPGHHYGTSKTSTIAQEIAENFFVRSLQL